MTRFNEMELGFTFGFWCGSERSRLEFHDKMKRDSREMFYQFNEEQQREIGTAKLNQWLRRRLRAIAWKQWKRGRTRFAELRGCSFGRDLAAQTDGTPHGPWRLASSPMLTIALPNAFFASLGLAPVAAQRHA